MPIADSILKTNRSIIGIIYYRPQRSCGKVIFYTCLWFCSRGDVWQTSHLGRHPLEQTPPRGRHNLWATPLPGHGALQRTVRILLECILVSRQIYKFKD